jgi:hypothetical protein
MRYKLLCGLVLLVLALNSMGREPIYLGEGNGRAILESIANNTSNLSNVTPIQTGNATRKEGGLWSWGTTPAGYRMGESGELALLPNTEEWYPSI